MGTLLYAKGIYINRCYDELNLSQPDLIREIHHEYLQAGAEIIETNTFGGNPVRLARHGLVDRLRDINLAGVALAFFLEYINRTVRGINDIEDFVGLKVIGTIPIASQRHII